jgi:hypothetical protein
MSSTISYSASNSAGRRGGGGVDVNNAFEVYRPKSKNHWPSPKSRGKEQPSSSVKSTQLAVSVSKQHVHFTPIRNKWFYAPPMNNMFTTLPTMRHSYPTSPFSSAGIPAFHTPSAGEQIYPSSSFFSHFIPTTTAANTSIPKSTLLTSKQMSSFSPSNLSSSSSSSPLVSSSSVYTPTSVVCSVTTDDKTVDKEKEENKKVNKEEEKNREEKEELEKGKEIKGEDKIFDKKIGDRLVDRENEESIDRKEGDKGKEDIFGNDKNVNNGHVDVYSMMEEVEEEEEKENNNGCGVDNECSDLDEYEYEINYPQQTISVNDAPDGMKPRVMDVPLFEEQYYMCRSMLTCFVYMEVYDYPPRPVIPMELMNIVIILVNLLLK